MSEIQVQVDSSITEASCPFSAWVLSPQGGDCLAVKLFPEIGFYAAVRRLLYHYTMIFGEIGDYQCYSRRWCYQTRQGAFEAMAAWDGLGEPEGWHRSPETGRRRPNGDPALEYIEP